MVHLLLWLCYQASLSMHPESLQEIIPSIASYGKLATVPLSTPGKYMASSCRHNGLINLTMLLPK
jgi:hypothetical protein